MLPFREKNESASLYMMRDLIKKTAPSIGLKPYSHNIVYFALADISREFGVAEANQAIRDFNLADKGFNEESELTEPTEPTGENP